MTPEEIKIFKKEIADPRMKQILANITIPEGYCCINNLEISFLDGRSYGADTQFVASGLQNQDGIIQEYYFDEIDISCADFVNAHKNCIFLADGDLKIYVQPDNLTLTTDISNLCYRCFDFFPELIVCSKLVIQSSELDFLKMKELLVEQAELCSPQAKTPLNEKIQAAAVRATDDSDKHPIENER